MLLDQPANLQKKELFAEPDALSLIATRQLRTTRTSAPLFLQMHLHISPASNPDLAAIGIGTLASAGPLRSSTHLQHCKETVHAG